MVIFIHRHHGSNKLMLVGRRSRLRVAYIGLFETLFPANSLR